MAKKQPAVKLETGKQCRAAIREIQRKTDWSLKRLADFMGINYETLRKVEKGYTRFPGDWLRGELATTLQLVRSDMK